MFNSCGMCTREILRIVDGACDIMAAAHNPDPHIYSALVEENKEINLREKAKRCGESQMGEPI